MKDQNETVHTYIYDHLGRLTEDRAAVAAGSGIDEAVLRIERTYEVRGMLETITSYDGGHGHNLCATGYASALGELTFPWSPGRNRASCIERECGTFTTSVACAN